MKRQNDKKTSIEYRQSVYVYECTCITNTVMFEVSRLSGQLATSRSYRGFAIKVDWTKNPNIFVNTNIRITK